MKKSLLVSLLCLIGIGSMQTMKAEAQTPEFYAVFESDGVTMTLYYDEYRTSRGGVTEWWNKSIKNDITTVELSVNMKNGCPISTANWFQSFKKLTTINNLAYLNTSKVADMSYMFSGCSALKSLNLQSFYTRNVTNMSYMFANCTALTNLNVYSFDTRNVTDMSYMFYTCSALTELDLSGFTTPQVTNMKGMFYQCYALKTLDLSLFNPISVTDMTSMFASCSALTTIYCGANFSINSPASNGMFTLCNKLVGGNGTKYDSNYKDATYAHPDEEGNPGYFTAVEVENVLYAQLNANEKIMTIYCGNVLESETGITNWWVKYSSAAEKYHVTTIVLDQSVAKARPTSTEDWFYAFGDVTSFQGLEYLNTEDVKDMSNMFTRCISLTSLDVSSFNTANVEDMSYMFSGCLELKSLNISGFNTAKVKNMCGMFSTCMKLESVDVSGFNTENVTDMSNMFFTCSSLGSVNVSSFNVDKVTDMSFMFYGCSSLTEIICNRGWNSSSIYADYMFGMNINLKGGNGFAYALLNPADNTYAWPDGMDGKPGYFTQTNESAVEEIYAVRSTDKTTMTLYYDRKREQRNGVTNWSDYKYSVTNVVLHESMKDARPNSTASWFASFSELTTIEHLEYLNTSEVTDMSNMFLSCVALTALDVSRFNTSKVTNMKYLFSNCEVLASLDVSRFDTRNVTDMSAMFFNCKQLTTLDVSHFDTRNVTDMSAMFIMCEKLTSLDLTSFDTKKVTNMFWMFAGCPALTTIYCNEDWSVSTTLTSSDDMFSGCTSLVGGNGTNYNDANPKDVTYARLDEDGKKGYFTKKKATAIDNVSANLGESQKLLRNGQIFILRGDHIYTLTGQKVK